MRLVAPKFTIVFHCYFKGNCILLNSWPGQSCTYKLIHLHLWHLNECENDRSYIAIAINAT